MKGCGTVNASLVHYLGNSEDIKILGVAPAPVVKVNNKYRYNVTVCGRNSKRIRDVIAHIICQFSEDKRYRGLSIYADINRID